MESGPIRSIHDDDRGVTVAVGVIFLFAFLIIGLSLYQATVVPSQNKTVEFNHMQDAEASLVGIRNAVIETKFSGEDQLARIRLGTTYPSRIIALNPPNPTGTLRTTENTTMVVENETGVPQEVCPVDMQTRAIRYNADYNEFTERPTYILENTVLYRQFADGQTLPVTGQKLVQGKTINLIPIKTAYHESQSGAVSFEPRAGLLEPTEISNPQVRLNTSLSEQHWERLLDGEVSPSNISVENGTLGLDLHGVYTISCGPVAIGETPPGGSRGSDPNEINPASPGEVSLENVTYDTGSNTVRLTFSNLADTTNFTEGRINFYNGNQVPAHADIYRENEMSQGEDPHARLEMQADFTPFEPFIEITGGTETEVVFAFDNGLQSKDWFVITVRLESGETGLYFISQSV